MIYTPTTLIYFVLLPLPIPRSWQHIFHLRYFILAVLFAWMLFLHLTLGFLPSLQVSTSITFLRRLIHKYLYSTTHCPLFRTLIYLDVHFFFSSQLNNNKINIYYTILMERRNWHILYAFLP